MKQELMRWISPILLAFALSACSAIELRARMAKETAAAAGPAADAHATIAALEAAAQALSAEATQASRTLVALRTAAAPKATAAPDATAALFASAEVLVYGRVPVDSDRLNTIAALAFDAESQLLVSTRAGEIYRLSGAGEDGLADETVLIFADEDETLLQVAGMTTRGGSIILLNGGRLSQLTDSDGDGFYETITQLAEALPASETPLLAGNSIVQAPDGRLFSANLNSGEILLIQLLQ